MTTCWRLVDPSATQEGRSSLRACDVQSGAWQIEEEALRRSKLYQPRYGYPAVGADM
jgi:hypothetical protein